MKKHKGFTLIELLTVLAIMSILMAMAIPDFTQLVKNNRLRTQANEFVVAMNIARSEAIKRGEAVNVTANNPADAANEWGPGWIVRTASGFTVLVYTGLNTNMTLDSTGNLPGYQYLATGLISTGDTLNLCDDRTGETGRQISVTNTGRVSVGNVACP